MTSTIVIPVREGAPTKARRYITEGRLTIQSIHAGRIWAECRGDGAVYVLGFAHHRWHCSCPCRTADCCHLYALRLVTDRPGEKTDDR
jgi:hypothetical protein